MYVPVSATSQLLPYLLVFTRRLRQGCLSADGMFGRVTLDATSAPLS